MPIQTSRFLRYPTVAALLTTSVLGLLLTAASAAPVAPKPAAAPIYERDILPLLHGRCVGCHGSPRPNAGLDVRNAGDLLEGGYSGPSVVPGAPEKSLLYQMLADGRMPKGGARLTPAELAKVARWIKTGAKGQASDGHWAFRPPVAPKLPMVKAAARVRNPIDRFLLADLERAGLSYAPEADRRTLLRRVTYDLIGLPPTPAELDAYLADTAPDAYERVVDRLLADTRYGERWARHWLDTAGYADSEGVLQEDRLRPNAWRYRDYVIRSFNADKPYDQFLREQIAGDELSDYRHAKSFKPDVVEKLDATGFLRTAVDATRDDFNTHQYGEYQYRMLHDTQTIVVSTTLGLTVQCARCHNHKYEPVSQKDYYRIQALFTPAVRPRGTLLPTNRRQIVAATAEEQEQARKVNEAVDAAKRRLTQEQAAALAEAVMRHLPIAADSLPDRDALLAAAKVPDAQRTAQQKALVARHQPAFDRATELARVDAAYRKQLATIQSALATEEGKRITLTSIRAFYDQDTTPPPTPLLVRGDWLRPGDPVDPGVPEILDDPRSRFALPSPAKDAVTTGRRTAFANWITRPNHPLTGRVLVNRLWAHHFGVGIAPLVDNLGRSGPPPTNQPLLDWLAVSFVSMSQGDNGSMGGLGGWRLKPLHRLIVTSAAYRQQSALRPDAAAKDPENRLLWRQRPRRLEAEAVRDAVLYVSGSLDPTMYGESVPIATQGTGEVVVAGEEGKGRRSIYVLVRRSQPVHLLDAFDAPIIETNCTRRSPSTTATQALALMNSTFVTAQGKHFAERVLAAPAEGDGQRIDAAYRLALSRSPSPVERARMLDFLGAQRLHYTNTAGENGEKRAWADLCQTLLSANEFVYLD